MTNFEGLGPQLAAWLPSQRWFQGKDRAIRGLRIADAATLDESLSLVIAELDYDGHPSDRYLVPLCHAEDGWLEFGGRRWADALGDATAVRSLAGRSCVRAATPTAQGDTVEGEPVTGLMPPSDISVRALRAEQSNTSAILGEKWILKVLRRLETGTHPDIELTAVLTAHGFPHVPVQHGSLALVGERGPTALAVLSEFVSDGEEGWALATADTATGGTDLLSSLPALGEAVADLHLTLGEALGQQPAGPAQSEAWIGAMTTQLDRVLAAARRRGHPDAVAVADREGQIRKMISRLGEVDDLGPLVRIHGDLHLGQVLLAPGQRWLLLDFEGEPTRSLAERRAPGSPLRDVAGMLRSFDYAAAEPHDGQIPPEAAAWRDSARARFLDGYLARAAPLLPANLETLLASWELDKAIYELGYELANRPHWAPIPARGILALVGGS